MKIKLKNFEIGTIILITLNGPYYFDPYDGMREVILMSKEEFDKKFDIPLKTNHERWAKIKKLGWTGTFHMIGQYVGGRPDQMKIKPFYGISHPDSEYFIISKSQIKTLVELKSIK
ncbi:MAG: hypothetical protein WC606_03800 [Candidatus Absconditabacterales bacterium]|jgi:hypothetical protein